MIALLFVACSRVATFVEGGGPVAAEDPSTAWKVDGVAFQVAPLEDSQLFAALQDHAIAGIPGWRILPFSRGGNFVRWRACSPTVRAPACDGGAVANDQEPGTAWRELSTLTYDSEWPKCGGVIYSSGTLPADAGWGGFVWLGVNGKSVVGDGFGATALRVVDGAVAQKLLVVRHEVELGAETLRLAADAPRDEALAFLGSPENLAAMVSLRYAALIARVDAALEAERVTVWQEGPYLGGGIPPERTAVPASTAEAAALAAAAREELVAERDAILAAAPEIHAVLHSLMPAAALKR